MKGIRILDLNIWNYNEPWHARRDLIVDLVRDTQPDLVALQEIRHRDWGGDILHQADQILAALPGYTAIWHPAHHWPAQTVDRPGHEWEGLAILSRYPIVDLAVAHLSRDPGDPRDHFQRLILGAQVWAAEGPFWLFNTHYPLSEQARNRIVVESFYFVTQTAGEHPFALTGDLNAEPQDLAVRFLAGQAQIDGQRGDWVDAWASTHPGEPGHTYPAWDPQKRIDYLFVPSALAVDEIAVVGMVASREIPSPSDHCGLLATLGIKDEA